jgi:hypothetical protein
MITTSMTRVQNTFLFGRILLLALPVFAGCGFGHRKNIERVLQQDAALNAEIAEEAGLLDVAWDQSGVVGRYVSGLRRIDLRGCPDDFQDAFRKHIEAWAAYESVARSYGGVSGFVKGFLSGGLAVLGAYSEGDAAQKEIETTWQEVLRIAGEYHAKIPE